MSRYALVLALFFVAAEGNCQQACVGCAPNEASGTAFVGEGEQDRELFTRFCTTCGHSTIVVTGEFPSELDTNNGTLTVRLRFRCGTIDDPWGGFLGTGTVVLHHDGKKTFRTEWTEVNVKSPCGERTKVDYTVRLDSTFNHVIKASASITCPQELGAASPTGPSRVSSYRTGVSRKMSGFPMSAL